MNQYEIAVLYHPDLEVDLTKAEDRVKKISPITAAKLRLPTTGASASWPTTSRATSTLSTCFTPWSCLARLFRRSKAR